MESPGFTLGSRIAPPRFLIFMLVFATMLALFWSSLGPARATLTAFDAGSLAFLVLIAPLFFSGNARIRSQARGNDANRALLLTVSVVVSLVVLVAVMSEMHAKTNRPEIALIVGTLALTWLFSNTVYALHYAHLYYQGDERGADRGGIDFPGNGEPDYWDFAYFSFTLGMTFQTSDVEVPSRFIRRVVLGHCMAAFVFNIGVLALTINVLGGG
ncbi:MAG: DUF1345 domain-containing protein [Sphingomonas sp.]|jgi:uncharacterized membrane protein